MQLQKRRWKESGSDHIGTQRGRIEGLESIKCYNYLNFTEASNSIAMKACF